MEDVSVAHPINDPISDIFGWELIWRERWPTEEYY